MIQIVVGQRGWTWVGRVSRSGDEVVIRGARCVRRWGTPGKGLGFLASDGPQPETKLDDPATVRIHPLAIVATYDCDEAKWEGKL